MDRKIKIVNKDIKSVEEDVSIRCPIGNNLFCNINCAWFRTQENLHNMNKVYCGNKLMGILQE